MILILDEGDVAALAAFIPDPPPAPSPQKVPARPPENRAARAQVGDLVRYTPFSPEHANDLVTGVIVKAFRTWLGNYGWKIRAVSAEDGSEYYVRRYSSGGAVMIICERAEA